MNVNQLALQVIIDRLAIEDCMRRYTRGVDRLDRELLLSAYHLDAQEHHGPVNGSPEEFADWYWRQQTDIEWTRHMVSNQTIEFDGDAAYSEAYFAAWTRLRGSNVVTETHGRYIDQFARRAGEWRIAYRVVVREARFDMAVENRTDRGPMSPMSHRDREDLSYSRPLSADPRPLAK